MARHADNLARAEVQEPALQLGRYELTREIARSDWGSLWRGRTVQDGEEKHVVVRRIPRGTGIEQHQVDLVCEAAWLSIEIDHPSVAGVIDVVITADEVGVVSEQVGRHTLAQLLADHRSRGVPMAENAALHIALDVLAGLGAAHHLWAELGSSAEPFFGGLEPGSVLVDQRGVGKLVDLGISGCVVTPSWTDPNSELAQYRAPERRRLGAHHDARADIYSVGVLLWEMLANRRLSPAMLQAPPKAITGSFSPAIAELVARALDPDPRVRFQSTDEMAQAIRGVVMGSRPPRSVRPSLPPARPAAAASGIRLLAPPLDSPELVIPKAPALPTISPDAPAPRASEPKAEPNPQAAPAYVESPEPPQTPPRWWGSRFVLAAALLGAALATFLLFAVGDDAPPQASSPPQKPAAESRSSSSGGAPMHVAAANEPSVTAPPLDPKLAPDKTATKATSSGNTRKAVMGTRKPPKVLYRPSGL